MCASKDFKNYELLVQKMDSKYLLKKVWKINGGVSAEVHGLAVENADGNTIKMAVRKHGYKDISRNPKIAENEFRLLQVLKAQGIPVPFPYFIEKTGEILSAPCLVMEYIEGTPNIADDNVIPCMKVIAAKLSRIHRLEIRSLNLTFLPSTEEVLYDIFKKGGEDFIQRKLKSAIPLSGNNKKVLLHGDFWPGNVLWNDGKIASIIDWEDASIGDPLADLANARLEVLFQYGKQAMNYFTDQYQSIMSDLDYSNLPFWDLFAALRLSNFADWGLEIDAVNRMGERRDWFIKNALNE